MKKLIFILIALLLIPTTPVRASAGAEESIVRVVTPDFSSSGTGFIVAQSTGKTVLATNLHVVGNNTNVKILLTDVSGIWLDATVTFLQDDLDMVILTVTSGLDSRPALPIATSDTVSLLDDVVAYGFPAATDTTTTLPSTSKDVTATNGSISRLEVEVGGFKTFAHSARINAGNSGGPLVNDDGAVIGVNTYGDTETDVNLAIYSDYLVDALDQMGVSYTLTGSVPAFNPGDEPIPVPTAAPDDTVFWEAIGASLGGALLLIIVCVVVLRMRKKKAAAPAVAQFSGGPSPGQPYAGQPSPGQPYAGQPSPGQPYGATAPVSFTQPAAVTPGVKLTGIRGTGGQYNAKSFPVASRTVIGRDGKRCNLIFDPQTNGVSALHCEIVRSGDSLQLTDLGSTYGTFLNGSKLAVNVPSSLQPGSSFYLGEKRNSFVVY
jgi:hypothetical protein